MAKKKEPKLRYDVKEFPCSGYDLDTVYQRVKEFISSLPPEASAINTRFDFSDDGYGSNGIAVEVNWYRPLTAAEIQAEENTVARQRERKLQQYKALKKELGL